MKIEGFKPFEPEKKKSIMPENAVESGPEIKFEKRLGRRRGYNFEEIKELEAPIEKILEQLKDSIDSEKYDVIIGDDTSGRIPTLIFSKIIEARIHKLHPDLTPEEQRDALKTYFIDGAAAAKWDGWWTSPGGDKKEMDQANKNLFEYFKSEKHKFKKKILLITEYINIGRVTKGFVEIFDKLGIPYDIVTIARIGGYSQAGSYSEAGEVISENGGRLFTGSYGDPPKIFGKPSLSGVVKKAFEYKNMTIRDIHGQPYVEYAKKQREKGPDDKLEDPKKISRDIKMTRQDVDLLVKKILEKVWGDEK